MKIFSINNFSKANQPQESNFKQNDGSRFGLKLTAPLSQDTVSFGAAKQLAKQVVLEPVRSGATVGDIIKNKFMNDVGRLTRIATTYLDILESIAVKLKDHGVSFDREYCEKNPVKSPASYMSKIKRSGSFNVPDVIRATLYVNNPYDLSILSEQIIPEMAKRGYIVADNFVNISDLMKRGYIPTKKELAAGEKLMPDLDVRLADVADQKVVLGKKYQYSIGSPQKSGYEDIQMRFIRQFADKQRPVQHELLILFGPSYAAAKHLESERVYNHTRVLGELNLLKNYESEDDSVKKVARYIDLIKKMMNGKISQKLYENAKNKDLYGISDEIPIVFSETDRRMFASYFIDLSRNIKAAYAAISNEHKGDVEFLKQINSEYRKDNEFIKKVHQDLQETIDYFDSGAYKKELKV